MHKNAKTWHKIGHKENIFFLIVWNLKEKASAAGVCISHSQHSVRISEGRQRCYAY